MNFEEESQRTYICNMFYSFALFLCFFYSFLWINSRLLILCLMLVLFLVSQLIALSRCFRKYLHGYFYWVLLIGCFCYLVLVVLRILCSVLLSVFDFWNLIRLVKKMGFLYQLLRFVDENFRFLNFLLL